VNATTGDGRSGDAGPRRREIRLDPTQLSAEGKLRRAAAAWRGTLFRDRGKRREPHDRQRHATRPQGHGGANRRGGAKPRGRHAGWELAFPSRRRIEPRSDARGRCSGNADSAACTMEGRSLDNPKRGNPALRPGRKDRNASGKSAPRSGGSREPACECRRADRSKVLEGPNAATCSKAEEGSSERPGSRNFDRNSSPRRWHLSKWRRGADHAPARRRAASTEVDRCFGSGSFAPRREEDAERKNRTPLKTR
jgi:hypothetical protein